MRTRSQFIAAVLGFSVTHVIAAQAAPAASLERDSAARTEPGAANDSVGFVVGNVEYLLVHELAHLVISDKDVPIVGPVENAADYIAAMALIREEPLDPLQRDRAQKFRLATASAFAASWQAGETVGAEVAYWGEHALTIQRYYQIACLLYGSDPAAFAAVPRAAGLPATRAETCVAEYARAAKAVEWLLDSYGRLPNDPPGAATEIVYERAPTAVSAAVVRRLKSLELLEKIVARLHERFTLERPFRLVLRTCGQYQAAWLPDRRELAICYELLDALYVLALDATPLEDGNAKRRRVAH
jgi:hypothetical protein